MPKTVCHRFVEDTRKSVLWVLNRSANGSRLRSMVFGNPHMLIFLCLVSANLLPQGMHSAWTHPNIHHHSSIELDPTIRAESPSIVVDRDGRVVVAYVVWEMDREQIQLRRADGPDLPFTAGRMMSKGVRASHPGLAAHPDGSVWLVWCGLDALQAEWKQERGVFLRKVGPGEPGPIVRVSESGGWSCAPKISIEPELRGKIHIVWEKGSRKQIQIAYRSFSPEGRPIGSVETVRDNSFARRPSVLATRSGVHVAWDELVSDHPGGEPDPDYDVLLRSRLRSGWKPIVKVDIGSGLQAAPSLAADAQGNILVAYHSTRRSPLVKWWTIRKVHQTGVDEIVAKDVVSQSNPSGEVQGAEFPVMLVAKNRIVVVSRTSQGARLHALDASQVGCVLDLSTPGWGARGIQTGIAETTDGAMLIARRGRKRLRLERLRFQDTPVQPVVFTPTDPRVKKESRRMVRFLPQDLRAKKPRGRKSYHLLMGDLHMHSAMSDGTGTVDEILARAWSRGMDFAALTDHDVLVGFEMMPSKFDEIAWIGDLFEARYDFVILHAFEWTSIGWPKGYGHRNVYFRKSRPARLCNSLSGCSDTHTLRAWLQRHRGISIPHHTSWTGTDWGSKDEPLVRLFEIVSIHGACEFAQNEPIRPRGEMQQMFARDGIKRGHRIGFVGGSDSHGLLWHHGVGWRQDPWLGGLTGLFVNAKRRQDVFDALYQRRCYATSGVPVYVWLRAGEIEMGSEGIVRGPIDLEYEVASELQIQSLEVIRDGCSVEVFRPGSTGAKGTWREPGILDPGWHSYYLRVQFRDRQPALAWSSPVYIKIEKQEEQ